MRSVVVSPKYQVVIPTEARKRLNIRPGQRLMVIVYNNRIELVPIIPVQEARGLLVGMETTVERERDRI